MNKGKVRDNEHLQYKKLLIDKILYVKGISKKSEFALRLRKKSSGELKRLLEGGK